MRINAYLLLGDPQWMKDSVLSYYPYVNRIYASHDVNGIGWSGQPIQVSECLKVLSSIDRDRKVVLLPGTHRADGGWAMDAETRQRQDAIDAASEGADWVLQLDSDEILPKWKPFERCLHYAHDGGWSSFWYPQRWLYSHIRGKWFLELARSRRRWRTLTMGPGPYALRSGSKVVLGRQDGQDRLVFDANSRLSPLRLQLSDALLHYSWIRSPSQLADKSRMNGHASDFDWAERLSGWRVARTHPVYAQLRSLIRPVEPGPIKLAYVRCSDPDQSRQAMGRDVV